MHLHDKGDARLSNAFLLTLVAYFIFQIIIRTSQPGALELDEAEQVFNSQQMLLGYGGQPPLYTWLQWAAFRLFGISLFGLSVLKNALLFVLCVSMYQTAKPFVGTVGAISVSSSLILLAPIGWESQIDRTHTVLATTLAALSLQSYFALLRHPSWWRRVLLGFFIGLGLQSKYNFAVFGAGLVFASIAVREHRRVIWNRDVWPTVIVAILCLLPHGLWFVANVEHATADTLHKMGIDGPQEISYVGKVASGLVHLVLGIAGLVSPFWILFAIASRPCWDDARFTPASPSSRFFLFLYAGALAWPIALAFGGYLLSAKGRWLQPLLFSLPLALFVVFPGTARPLIFRRMICIAGVVAACILAALALRPQVVPAMGKDLRIHQPYPELAAEVVRRFPHVPVLVGQNRHTAGNFRFQHASLRAVLLDDVLRHAVDMEGTVLFLVQAETEGGWQHRLRDAYPTAAVLKQGQIDARPSKRGGEPLIFDYALMQFQRAGSQPQHRNEAQQDGSGEFNNRPTRSR
ncbi:MAG TPA: glycosyltransferase family 39 protein [Noviherbaspirillum sp.]|nr:glycosyltransferase family 39 protein [Noviherbaspirillum sp.]